MKIQMFCLFYGALETACIQVVINQRLYPSHIDKDIAKKVFPLCELKPSI